jgi:hypothetical protein
MNDQDDKGAEKDPGNGKKQRARTDTKQRIAGIMAQTPDDLLSI